MPHDDAPDVLPFDAGARPAREPARRAIVLLEGDPDDTGEAVIEPSRGLKRAVLEARTRRGLELPEVDLESTRIGEPEEALRRVKLVGYGLGALCLEQEAVEKAVRKRLAELRAARRRRQGKAARPGRNRRPEG